MRYLFLLIGLFLGSSVWAQEATLRGVVRDTKSNPLEEVFVVVGKDYVQTQSNGTFNIVVPAPGTYRIVFSRIGYAPDTTEWKAQPDEVKILNVTLQNDDNVLDAIDLVDYRERLEDKIDLDPKNLEFSAGPTAGVEGLVKTLQGVVSNNEFSSQYSVRGGNFDENLVYVNGIEVYRPFLVRAGQQEGLSFVNPDMVGNIYFSAGGFEAQYGDKMSSVLDITYRKPESFGVRGEASLLGGSLTAEGTAFKDRLAMIGSVRYRTNTILLNSTDTEADFRPRFFDGQAYITYDITDEWRVFFLGNLSSNRYQVVPESRQTNFGTVQEALRLNVFFDGQENYAYQTRFAALGAENKVSDNLRLQFNTSVFQTQEQEYFDVIGLYRLGELDNDLGSDDFGEVKFLRGVGGFQDFARNNLDAIIFTADHKGVYGDKDETWLWGLKYQRDDIIDRYKEWERIDSAGYSIPHTPTSVSFDPNTGDTIRQYAEGLPLFSSYDSRVSVASNRLMGYLEYIRTWKAKGDWKVKAGLRSHYWSFNNQTTISPRASISWKPDWKYNWVFKAAGGYYHQPPFYREMRDISGSVNPDIRAQEAIHLVLGSDYEFKAWDRPFKWVTEVYYKDLNYLIPYELDNVRLRYAATNTADGFASGIDFRVNGEFVKGTESWMSFSLYRVMEDLSTDNAGLLPRPTDNRYNFNIFFQDHLPKDPTFRVSLTLTVTGGFPFGPPGADRSQYNFRAPPYQRVDIGFIKILKEEGKDKGVFGMFGAFKSVWLSLEVFNLLDNQNVASYLWVKDNQGGQYAVPNFLTSRLVNVKLRFAL